MKIQFSKYQGAGNDFVMINNLNGDYDQLSIEQIQSLCDRKFGIGADGLIKINASSAAAFEVDYYNSDGSKSFCGNGARCSVAFAGTLGIDINDTDFIAIDGLHTAERIASQIKIKMHDVTAIQKVEGAFVLDTGSPHYVKCVDDIDDFDIVDFGRGIRYSSKFKADGINVNLLERLDERSIRVATYERGVEDETLSCGTGVTACALVFGELRQELGEQSVIVQTKGGDLLVQFERTNVGSFSSIFLTGPAKFVFQGTIEV
ncbi:MAG: diaminopimelate epimerase [Bacteroidota bacterium]